MHCLLNVAILDTNCLLAVAALNLYPSNVGQHSMARGLGIAMQRVR